MRGDMSHQFTPARARSTPIQVASLERARRRKTWAALQGRVDRQIGPPGRPGHGRPPESDLDERVIDVGCGCGGATLELAERVGSGGGRRGRGRPDAECCADPLGGAPRRPARPTSVSPPPMPRPMLCGGGRRGRRFLALRGDVLCRPSGGVRQSAPGAKARWTPGVRRLARARTERLHDRAAGRRHAAASRASAAAAARRPGPSPSPIRIGSPIFSCGPASAASSPRPHDEAIGGEDLDGAVDFALKLGPLGAILREKPQLAARVTDAVRRALLPYVRPGQGVFLPSASWIVTAANGSS